jgi:dihydroorotate dehydrogenase electron transfer subunit
MISDCRIISHEAISEEYRRIRFEAPEICRTAKPGQFVHVQIPSLPDRIRRRPFSICDMEDGILTVVYKIVGVGTARLADAVPGMNCSIMGPLGTYFPECAEDVTPVLIDGGYGAAATLPIARRWKQKGILLLGARTEKDVLITDEYRNCGYDVRVATQDGSVGHQGLVTELIPAAIADTNGKCAFYSCGPNGMLMAVGKIALERDVECYLTLDHQMCCGVGACFACVVKVKSDSSPDGWRYSRSCCEGPVYSAKEVWYA